MGGGRGGAALGGITLLEVEGCPVQWAGKAEVDVKGGVFPVPKGWGSHAHIEIWVDIVFVKVLWLKWEVEHGGIS